MRSYYFVVTFLLSSWLFLACGSDPASQSAPVGITLKLQSRDVDVPNGTVSAEKNVTTESGNPWGKFINDAQVALGADPSSIVLDQATLTLQGTSTGVASLGEVFGGATAVSFVTNTSNTDYPVASSVLDTNSGTLVSLENNFDYAQVVAADRSELLSGSFKVVLTGVAESNFSTLSATADVVVTMTFSAYP